MTRVARRAARALLAAALLAAAGCSLVESFDGFDDGGAADGGARDAALDGPPSDSALDAPACPLDANLSSDPRNCGRCGHDCEQGACDAGACQPYTLLPDCGAWQGIAVFQQQLYWVTAGSIERAELDGGGATELVTGLDYPAYMAFTGSEIYFTMNAGIYVTPMQPASKTDFQQALKHTSASCTPDSGAGCETTNATGIAFDPGTNTLYWSGENQIPLYAVHPPDFGAITPAVTGESPHGLAVFGGYLWLATNGDNRIKRAPLDGGPHEVVADGQQNAYGIAVDATGVVWSDVDAPAGPGAHGSVHALNAPLPPLPAASLTVASGYTSPGGVAITPEAFYWSSQDGNIYKLVR